MLLLVVMINDYDRYYGHNTSTFNDDIDVDLSSDAKPTNDSKEEAEEVYSDDFTSDEEETEDTTQPDVRISLSVLR